MEALEQNIESYVNVKIIDLNIQYVREKIDLLNLVLNTEQPRVVILSERRRIVIIFKANLSCCL